MSSAEREEGRGGEMEMSAACRLPSLLPFFSALFPCHCTNRAAQSGPCKRSSCTHRTALRCLLCLCVGDRRARRSGEQRSSCPRHTMRLFGSLSLPFSLSLSLSLSSPPLPLSCVRRFPVCGDPHLAAPPLTGSLDRQPVRRAVFTRLTRPLPLPPGPPPET